jgi:hypothetical protein
MTQLVEYTVSIKTLFKLTDNLNAEFESAQDISNLGIEIQTPDGWQAINALVRKYTDAARYFLEDDLELTCATKHLVFEDAVCKPISTCTTIDTVNGSVKVIGLEHLGPQVLYDVAIDNPHLYITSNGIIHHNTTLAKCLFNELGVDPTDVRYINASHNTGVEYYRNLTGFVETMPSGDYRYILLDECLDENVVVWILRDGIEKSVPIKELDESNDLVKSYNIQQNRIEWRPFQLMDKGDREVIEIEFENGEVVVCTPNHKWYVNDTATGEPIVVRADQLESYGHILTI